MLKKINCFLGFCDACEDELETNDYILHLPTEDDVEEEMVNADWMLWRGQHWCENCRPSCDFCGHDFGCHSYGEDGCNEYNCTCALFMVYEKEGK
ncbi:hypothetical protein LCGC14_1374360 [marine sediment metagenome]|uniref:Uncharacterized protein n=1 Tax=marine sediment metagenome TaxID=412755 RepID=A0A0F9K4V0_9ZZZZ